MRDADELLRALVDARRVLLSGPVAPDGDSIGACLAFARVLRERGADAVVCGRLPKRYARMPDADQMVEERRLSGSFPAVVILDGDRLRLEPEVDQHFRAAQVRAIIDHHASTDPEGYSHTWLEPHAESTCGMLLRAFRRWGIPVDRDVAEMLYTGIVFDTGGFRHANTTPEALRLAADLLEAGIDHNSISVRTLCERTPGALHVMGVVLSEARFLFEGKLCLGAVPESLRKDLGRGGDLEGVIDALLNTVGTEVAALLLERADQSVKISLRSRGTVDVSKLARQLHPTGGGHPRAAGATVRGSLLDAERLLCAALYACWSSPTEEHR